MIMVTEKKGIHSIAWRFCTVAAYVFLFGRSIKNDFYSSHLIFSKGSVDGSSVDVMEKDKSSVLASWAY